MITYTYKVSMTPGGIPVRCKLGQYDDDWTIVFTLYSASGTFSIESGTTAKIRGTKRDGLGYSANATINISAGTVTVAGDKQITAVAGDNLFELVLLKGTKELSTANIIFSVEPAAMDAGTLVSDSQVQEILDMSADVIAASDNVNTLRGNFAPAYSTSATYSVGDYVMYNNQLYRCKTAITTAESWTSGHWTAVALGDDVSDLKSELINVSDAIRKINYITGTPIEGYYNSYTGSGIGVNAEWAYYPMFEIEPGFYYIASYNGAHVAFYDANKEYISGILVDNTKSNFNFLAPVNTKYMTYSYKMASGDQYVMRATAQDIEYVEPICKKLDKNVTLDFLHFYPILNFGKNLFNKHNLINGYCIGYWDANEIWRNENYCFCPDYIPVSPSNVYSFNRLCVIAEYDIDFNCVATYNKTAVGSGTITTSAATKYIRIGTQTSKINELQVEQGNARTSYQPFEYRLKSTSVITVKKDGTGDFTTIGDAVGNAGENDIIIVYPGTYEESIHAYDKRVHIIGTDRAKCVLTYSGLNYAKPPLEMAKGSVRNLTIKATNSGTEGAYHAYCVHIDNDNEANEALTFENVDFINEVHQAVGIGLRTNFTLTFDNCRFKAEDQAGLYCHDWETSDTSADKTGQKLIVRNCSIVNNSASRASIMLQSQELVDKGAEVVFQRNIVLNKGGGSLITMTRWDGRTLTNTNFLGSSDWVLSDDSALNTLDTINNL